MAIRAYFRLLLSATLLTIPLVALLIVGLDKPLALFFQQQGAFLKPFFEAVMVGTEWLNAQFFYHGLPVGWLVLLLAFMATRALRQPSCTVWLVTLLSVIASEGIANLMKLYFNRPRPSHVWQGTAASGEFWSSEGRFDAFPSGHTAWIAGLLLPLALQFPKLRPVLLSLIALVGMGRVVLGVHWLSDVVAAVYLALVLTCCFAISTFWLRPRPDFHLVANTTMQPKNA